eukprot:5615507-Alexandrium_andersonii.AAC.1
MTPTPVVGGVCVHSEGLSGGAAFSLGRVSASPSRARRKRAMSSASEKRTAQNKLGAPRPTQI